MLRATPVTFILVSLATSTIASAKSGYHKEVLRSETHALSLSLDPASVHCGEPDSWDQSILEVRAPELSTFTVLTTDTLAKLFDGRCDEERTDLLATVVAGGGRITAAARLELYEYTQWGVIEEGTAYERAYCTREVDQAIDVRVDDRLDGYQSITQLTLSELPHELCVALYPDQALDAVKTDELPAGDGTATPSGCAIVGRAHPAAPGALLGLLVLVAATGRGRWRRRGGRPRHA